MEFQVPEGMGVELERCGAVVGGGKEMLKAMLSPSCRTCFKTNILNALQWITLLN